MVYTRYGNPVTVIEVNEQLGLALVDRPDAKGNPIRLEYRLSELRADGGIREIVEAPKTATA